MVWCVNWTHVIRNLAKLFQMQLATSKNFQERLMTHWLVGRRASKSSRVYPFRPPLHQFWESKLHLHLLLRLVVYPVPQFHRVKTVSCSYMFSVSCFAKLEAFVIHPNCLEMFSPKFPQKLDTFFLVFFSKKGGLSHDKPGSFWSPLPRHDLDHTWSWGLCQDNKPMGLDS